MITFKEYLSEEAIPVREMKKELLALIDAAETKFNTKGVFTISRCSKDKPFHYGDKPITIVAVDIKHSSAVNRMLPPEDENDSEKMKAARKRLGGDRTAAIIWFIQQAVAKDWGFKYLTATNGFGSRIYRPGDDFSDTPEMREDIEDAGVLIFTFGWAEPTPKK